MKPYVYQSVNEHELATVFAVAYDGLIHALGIDSLGVVSRHWVMDKSDFGLIKDLPKPIMAVWKEPLAVVPAQFIGVTPPDTEFDSMVTLNDESFLCYKGKNRQHLFQAYLQKAQLMGNKYPNLLFFWCLNNCVYISVFENGKLLFANNFEVNNKDEIVYFILAIARDNGFDSKPFTLLGDGNENQMNDLHSDFEKLAIELTHLNRENLYPGSNGTPDAHVSNLLSFLGGCEFPRDYN